MGQINDMVRDVHSNARNHGWWREERNFGELIALCHSELSETLEEMRNKHGSIYYKCNGGDYDGKFCNAHCERFGWPDPDDKTKYTQAGALMPVNCECWNPKPEGWAVELADCVIRIMDMFGYYGIDLEAFLAEKIKYNEGRPYMHGKAF